MPRSSHEWTAVFHRWSKASMQDDLKGFFEYLETHCNVTPGEVMTQEDLDNLAEASMTKPEELEELLMSSAWP